MIGAAGGASRESGGDGVGRIPGAGGPELLTYPLLLAMACAVAADLGEADALFRRTCCSRWAAMIKRVYETDPLVCPRCGGQMRIVAFVEARTQARHHRADPPALRALDRAAAPGPAQAHA